MIRLLRFHHHFWGGLVGTPFKRTSFSTVSNEVAKGNSFAASYGIKKLTGLTPGEHAMSFAKNYKIDPLLMTDKERECQTFHSSSLSEIFFETLDGIDCLRDPFSILK